MADQCPFADINTEERRIAIPIYMRRWVSVNYVAYLGAVAFVIITKLMTAPGANSIYNFMVNILNGSNGVVPVKVDITAVFNKIKTILRDQLWI